jgi:hypothetical protein
MVAVPFQWCAEEVFKRILFKKKTRRSLKRMFFFLYMKGRQ